MCDRSLVANSSRRSAARGSFDASGACVDLPGCAGKTTSWIGHILPLFSKSVPSSLDDLKRWRAPRRPDPERIARCGSGPVGSSVGSAVVISETACPVRGACLRRAWATGALLVSERPIRARRDLGPIMNMDSGLMKITDPAHGPGSRWRNPARCGSEIGQWRSGIGRIRRRVRRWSGWAESSAGRPCAKDCTLIGGDSGGRL